MDQDSQRIENLVNELFQDRDRDPCSEASRRADFPTIEALCEAGASCFECSDLLWTEAPNGSVLGFVHYEHKELQRVLLFRLKKQELVRLAESVLHFLGEPIQQKILAEVRALRQESKQQSSE